MILYIARHGIALERTDPKCPPDPERPLTAKGVQKTRSAALGLKELGVKPDLLITSPYVRAAQTAEIFAEALGFPTSKIRVSEALRPAANPADIVKEISHLKAKELMCFGHAPHLDQLISQLVGARGLFTELKKAGVASLQHTGTHSAWHLQWILTPKVLRQLA
jgi:phosphohistidine phosphatase